MATQIQLEVILAGNRTASVSCNAETTQESIKTKRESGNCFCIRVVLKQERDREKENVGGRPTKLNEKKSDRSRSRARDKKKAEIFFVGRTT